jgi:hypothetical protein
MAIDRSIVSALKIPYTPLPMRTSADSSDRRRNSPPPPPLDWDVALQAAAALLDETFGVTGSLGDPLMADMVQELAARLCAYNEMGTAVEHLHVRQDSEEAEKSPATGAVAAPVT